MTNGQRIFLSKHKSFETSSANSEEVSSLHEEEFFDSKTKASRRRPLSILGTIIGACATCYMCLLTVAVALFLVLILALGYYGYHKGFHVNEGVCYSKVSNSPMSFRLNTGCSAYDNIPVSRWEPFFRNESQVSSERIPSIDVEGKFIAANFYNGSLSESPFNGRAVVLVHGIRVCKETSAILIPAAMLHRQGFHVMTIDLRNHGDSFRYNNGMVSFGSLEQNDVFSAIRWIKEKTGLDSDSIGVFGSSMGASTGLVAWARDRSIPAFYADSPPCDISKVLAHNSEKVVPLFSGKFVLWMMCQASPLWTDYGCAPFPYDPAESSKLNLTIGGLDKAGVPIGEKLAFTRSIFFEHTDKDPIVPHRYTKECIDSVRETATYVDYHVGQDNSTDPPYYPAGKYIACDHHVKTMITETDTFEQRLLQFFEDNLLPSGV